jgi:Phage integrase, N-terminal SAM-like domain
MVEAARQVTASVWPHPERPGPAIRADSQQTAAACSTGRLFNRLRDFSEPCRVVAWYRARVVALADFELEEAAQAANPGVGSPLAGPEQADSGAEQAAGALTRLPDGAERVEDYAGHSKSEATIRAYAAGWRDFVAFCEQRHLSALPAADQTVAGYLADMADRGAKAATIARRLVVISQAHKAADLPSPTGLSLVRRVHAGIRRTLGTVQLGKTPALVDDLETMLEQLPGTRVGLRDRALLLLGFAGAFRRSELVGLNMADLEFTRAGLIVTLRKSKTDQEGRSRRLGIPFGSSEATCPVRSLQA